MSLFGKWPQVLFDRMPDEKEAVVLARVVREAVGCDANSPCDLDAVCTLGGFETMPLELDDIHFQAQIIPLNDNRFEIQADPRRIVDGVKRETSRFMRRQIARFFVGHEIGHSFFYWRKKNMSPRRPFQPMGPDIEEEYFCDVFAAALLLPQSVVKQATLTASDMLRLGKKFIVPLPTIEWACRDYLWSFWKEHVYASALHKAMASTPLSEGKQK